MIRTASASKVAYPFRIPFGPRVSEMQKNNLIMSRP